MIERVRLPSVASTSILPSLASSFNRFIGADAGDRIHIILEQATTLPNPILTIIGLILPVFILYFALFLNYFQYI
jgi:hypothetical protein